MCTVPARGGRLCEHFGVYKTINQIPYALTPSLYNGRKSSGLDVVNLDFHIGPVQYGKGRVDSRYY